MVRALAMPLEERKQRHAAMLKCVVKQDVRWWSETFMEALAKSRPTPAPRLAAAAI
jgi:trehalose 6-phosphate synthase